MRLFALLLTVPALFAQPNIPGLHRNKPNNAAAAKPVEFNREFYENLRNFAEGLYKQKERPDFRLKVDRQYESILREHAERAFQINTSPKSEIKIILEDRFRFFTGLYDNLMIQELVNRIGQQTAPSWSEKLVTFKLLADPVPRAESLASGTVYISTGLVASLDNRAQLAYILAHEAAHVAKDHWKTRIMIEHAKEEYAAMHDENQQQLVAFGSLVGLGAGMIAGAAGAKTATATLIGGVAGAAAGYAIAETVADHGRLNIDWNQFEEDEADDVAMKAMLEAKVNVKEVPNLYIALDKLALKDDRVGMGFWGDRTRMQERLQRIRQFLAANNVEGMQLTGSDPDFLRLIAELKRDNGILAYHYDMLDVARSNLEQAASVRKSDPAAVYYYAKILKATAKTDEERSKAAELFSQVIQTDTINHAYGAYLHRAIALIDTGGPAEKKQAAELLEQYIQRYGEAMDEINNSRNGRLPPHMDTIADYMRRAGIEDWKYSGNRSHLAAQRPPDDASRTTPPVESDAKPQPSKPKHVPVKNTNPVVK